MVNMTYFRLENSSIFYNNFNLSVFEFDRRKSKNNLVLIVGKNGSGKSALATELSPFPNELTRGATERFVEGTDGRKVLEFQNENSSWLCEIIYPAGKGTQCFIKKTDRKTGTTQELNENGNVRSYLECLEKEFGLSKNYTNVGYFSEEVLNVVNMTPTVRNSLISSFLPDTAEPIDAFKVVQRKYNQVRKECDNLEDDIKKIVINEYQIELEQAEINLVSKEKRLIYVREKLSEGRLYQNQNRAVTKGAVRMEIDKFLYDVKKFNENTAELTELIRSTNDYSGREKRLDEDILSVRDKMARNSTTLSYLDEEVGKLTTSVNMMQRNINRVNVDESIPVILMSIAEKEREQDAIVTELSKMTKNYPYERFDVNYNESTALTIVNSTLLQIYHMIEKLTSMKTEFSVNDIIEKPNEVRQSIEERLNRERSKIRKIKEKIANLEQRERTLRGAGLTKDILDFIPVGCSKDTCSLIRELYNYIDASSALGEIVKEKEMLYELERSINEHIETGVQRENSWISNMFLLVDQINDNVYQNRSHISRLHQNIRDKINVPLPQLVANIDAIMDMIKGWQNYISLEDKLRSIDTALTSLRVKKEQIDIEVSKNKELQRLRVEFEAATTRRRVATEDLMKNNRELERLQKIKEVKGKIDVLTKTHWESYDVLIDKRGYLRRQSALLYYKLHLDDIVSKLALEEGELEKTIGGLKFKITDIRSLVTKRETLEQRLENLQKRMALYDVLMQTWSPKTGYPSLLIKMFLDTVMDVANRDLNTIWGEEIVIEDFTLSGSEFLISVRKKGVLIKDVSECSKAEKATLGLVISLAIVEVGNKDTHYGIVRLDETDGGFDTQRRSTFLDVLLTRLEQMDCKCAFVISHNQEFATVPADIIALSTESLDIFSLENKNIIFQIQ